MADKDTLNKVAAGIEIPAGGGCNDCLFMVDFGSDYDCIAFGLYGTLLDIQIQNDNGCWVRARCEACLAAYPNGATIEIKPKEVHR